MFIFLFNFPLKFKKKNNYITLVDLNKKVHNYTNHDYNE